MIAHANKMRAQTLQDRFLDMLPSIRQQARFAFRAETPERRDDLVTEVIANCWVAFVRLAERSPQDAIYPTPLVQYAIKQVRDGRKVGSKLNVNDVSSDYAQRRKGIKVESLVQYSQRKQEWKEILVEDRHAGPAETAASRIDFNDWLRSLPRRSRRIAETLAAGERSLYCVFSTQARYDAQSPATAPRPSFSDTMSPIATRDNCAASRVQPRDVLLVAGWDRLHWRSSRSWTIRRCGLVSGFLGRQVVYIASGKRIMENLKGNKVRGRLVVDLFQLDSPMKLTESHSYSQEGAHPCMSSYRKPTKNSPSKRPNSSPTS